MSEENQISERLRQLMVDGKLKIEENQISELLRQLMADAKLKMPEIQISELRRLTGNSRIFADPEHEGVILMEVPDHLPLEPGRAIREINGRRYYTGMVYKAPVNYFEYINDPALPAFPDTATAHTFIMEKAIRLQIHGLILFWNGGVVHESITSLSHTENSKSFSIQWSKRPQNGV